MLPFIVGAEQAERLRVGDYLVLPGIRAAVERGLEDIAALLVRDEEGELRAENFPLSLKNLTEDERSVILDGCLINQLRAGGNETSEPLQYHVSLKTTHPLRFK
jgi:aconitate hydratase